MRTNSVSVYLLIAFVAFIVFLPWVRGYFLGDDWMLYARNSGRPLPDQLQAISDASNSASYRPLFEVSLAWVWSSFGFNPIGHHLVNLALHALNAVLVAVLAQRLAQDRRVSLLAGLTFALLSCHTEAVVWMTARHGMIVTAFALSSVLSYIRFRDRGGWFWWAGAFLLYVLSFGFKETALALPLLLAFFEFVFPLPKSDKRWRPMVRQFIPLMPLFAVGGACLLFRLIVGGGYDVPFTVLSPPRNLLYYFLVETIAFPVSTQFLSRFPLATMSTIAVLAFACVLCLILARGRILRDRLACFGALWMLFGLVPVMLIVAERTTYLSSVGWALASAATIILAWDVAAQRRASLARWLVVLAMVIFLGANLVTLTQRSYWRDRAADISENLFLTVRIAMQELPPGKDNQLWLFNVPDHIEYSDAFGNRILFAVWLLQDQWGVGEVKVSLFQDDNASPQEWAAQLLSERATEGAVAAFYWQHDCLVELDIPESMLSP